jgi:hypothetical protein
MGSFFGGEDLSEGIFGNDSLFEFVNKLFTWERLGYVYVDSINYYTTKLQEYNTRMIELQKKYNEMAARADDTLKRKLKSRADTRVAALFEGLSNIAVEGAKAVQGKG